MQQRDIWVCGITPTHTMATYLNLGSCEVKFANTFVYTSFEPFLHIP
jgi:hypothetical protein